MGRTGHPTLILGTASIALAATGIGVVLTHGDGPVSKAPTTVSAAAGAELVAPNGQTVKAHVGERVPNGYVVRTGRTGSATLTTRGRLTYVERSAALDVVNGAEQQLRTGRAVVDAQRGPAVQLDLADDVLAVPSGSATEADRSVSVVIGALHGPAAVTSSTGSRLDLRSLSQVVVSGDALPSATTPLHLNDNSVESTVVPALVRDDNELDQLADGINSTSTTTTGAIEASWSGTLASLPHTAPRSEQVLPLLLADASTSAPGNAQQRYNRVVSWRQAGGSWGVIAELLGTHYGAVDAALANLTTAGGSGQVGTVSLRRLASGTPESSIGGRSGKGKRHHGGSGSSTSGGGSKSGSGSGSKGGSGGSGSGGSGGSGGGGVSVGGTPVPTPTPTKLLSTVVGTVTGVVKTVVGSVIPTQASTPTPAPSPSSSGLLGGLLGGLGGG